MSDTLKTSGNEDSRHKLYCEMLAARETGKGFVFAMEHNQVLDDIEREIDRVEEHLASLPDQEQEVNCATDEKTLTQMYLQGLREALLTVFEIQNGVLKPGLLLFRSIAIAARMEALGFALGKFDDVAIIQAKIEEYQERLASPSKVFKGRYEFSTPGVHTRSFLEGLKYAVSIMHSWDCVASDRN